MANAIIAGIDFFSQVRKMEIEHFKDESLWHEYKKYGSGQFDCNNELQEPQIEFIL